MIYIMGLITTDNVIYDNHFKVQGMNEEYEW